MSTRGSAVAPPAARVDALDWDRVGEELDRVGVAPLGRARSHARRR